MNITKQERDKLRADVKIAVKEQASGFVLPLSVILALLDMIDRPAAAPDIKAAREALDNLDDYARMDTGVNAYGPRGVLEAFIDAVETSRPAASGDVRERFIAANGGATAPLDTRMNDNGEWSDRFTRARWEAWQAASAERAPVVGLSDDQIEELARKHNLDGSMLHGSRMNDYVLPFARAILAAANGEQQ